jgi:DUF4097 and DUF4098 domain-containing protein YvlB
MLRSIAIALLAVLGTLTACVNSDDSHTNSDKDDQTSEGSPTHTVNGSIHVKTGEKKDDVSTVNGSIHIDDNAVLTSAQTVNGSITVGAHSTTESLSTVNGSITLGDGASVSHTISAVNGRLTLHQGADVTGTVANVNGHILLEAAHVGGGIRTVSGDIDIGGNSHVEGGILVKKQRTQIFWFFQWNSSDTPRIVIGPGAVVQGDLRFERKVLLYVSDRATIGPVIGATAVKFSGETPPG